MLVAGVVLLVLVLIAVAFFVGIGLGSENMCRVFGVTNAEGARMIQEYIDMRKATGR